MRIVGGDLEETENCDEIAPPSVLMSVCKVVFTQAKKQ
jgi:hypothetical protein